MILSGRRIVGGRAEGIVLSTGPLSFLGGVDQDTGEVREPGSPARGERVADRVLVCDRAKGSTVGSYVLYGLRKRDAAPRAILAGEAETILAVGAVIADIPTVDRIPAGLLLSGDRVLVDATSGSVELPDVRERPVVSCFLEREGRILALRRSDRVGSFRGKWSGVSGFLEENEELEARARTEVEEETGIIGLDLLSRGNVVRSRGPDNTVYVIHPFRFEARAGDVRLNWENVESRWVTPEELSVLDGVPMLVAAYEATLNR